MSRIGDRPDDKNTRAADAPGDLLQPCRTRTPGSYAEAGNRPGCRQKSNV